MHVLHLWMTFGKLFPPTGSTLFVGVVPLVAVVFIAEELETFEFWMGRIINDPPDEMKPRRREPFLCSTTDWNDVIDF